MACVLQPLLHVIVLKLIDKLANPMTPMVASAATAVSFRKRPEEAIRFVVAVPLALLLAKVTKLFVHEQRPRVEDAHPEQSFPSGHSTAAAAYALSLVLAKRAWRALPIAMAAIATVNLSRLLEREHWLHDVLAGNAYGVAGAIGGAGAARLVRRRRHASR